MTVARPPSATTRCGKIARSRPRAISTRIGLLDRRALGDVNQDALERSAALSPVNRLVVTHRGAGETLDQLRLLPRGSRQGKHGHAGASERLVALEEHDIGVQGHDQRRALLGGADHGAQMGREVRHGAGRRAAPARPAGSHQPGDVGPAPELRGDRGTPSRGRTPTPERGARPGTPARRLGRRDRRRSLRSRPPCGRERPGYRIQPRALLFAIERFKGKSRRSADRALHLQLDQPVHLDGVFHRQAPS